jgi:hypothetical protein
VEVPDADAEAEGAGEGVRADPAAAAAGCSGARWTPGAWGDTPAAVGGGTNGESSVGSAEDGRTPSAGAASPPSSWPSFMVMSMVLVRSFMSAISPILLSSQ